MGPARKEPDKETYSGRCAARLRQLRERAKLTVPDAARKIGITMKMLYNIESGTSQPNLDIMPAVMAAYGLKNTRSVFPEK